MVGSNLRKETCIHFVLTCLLQMMVENWVDPWAYGRMLNPDWSHQTFSQKLVRSAQGGILLPNDQDPAHSLVIGGYKGYKLLSSYLGIIVMSWKVQLQGDL